MEDKLVAKKVHSTKCIGKQEKEYRDLHGKTKLEVAYRKKNYNDNMLENYHRIGRNGRKSVNIAAQHQSPYV